jgi:hypothetical protein
MINFMAQALYSLVTFGKEAGWVPEPVGTTRRREYS